MHQFQTLGLDGTQFEQRVLLLWGSDAPSGLVPVVLEASTWREVAAGWICLGLSAHNPACHPSNSLQTLILSRRRAPFLPATPLIPTTPLTCTQGSRCAERESDS